MVALDAHLLAQRGSGVFDRRAEVEVVLGGFGRRHEHVQDAVARLDTERGANHERIRLEPARRGLGASTPGRCREIARGRLAWPPIGLPFDRGGSPAELGSRGQRIASARTGSRS